VKLAQIPTLEKTTILGQFTPREEFRVTPTCNLGEQSDEKPKTEIMIAVLIFDIG
jgi:hypothetical protein